MYTVQYVHTSCHDTGSCVPAVGGLETAMACFAIAPLAPHGVSEPQNRVSTPADLRTCERYGCIGFIFYWVVVHVLVGYPPNGASCFGDVRNRPIACFGNNVNRMHAETESTLNASPHLVPLLLAYERVACLSARSVSRARTIGLADNLKFNAFCGA